MKALRTEVFDRIDSTNLQARRIAAAGERESTLIIAREQTAGRGRMGRSFYSPDGTGLYMTLLCYPEAPLCDLAGLTCAAAWATALAIEELTGATPAIKWVNDLYLHGRKVCGILCESVGTPHGTAVLVGIGVNLTTRDFPDELAGIAGSLQTEITPETLATRICERLLQYVRHPDNALWLDGYRARFMLSGMHVTCILPTERFEATVRGISDSGSLLVTDQGGQDRELWAGEVSIGATDPASPFYKS